MDLIRSEYDVLVVGGKAVGKTSILQRILSKPFPAIYNETTTIQAHRHEFENKAIGCNSSIIFRDIPGDRLNSISEYFRREIKSNIAFIFVVTDIGNNASFQEAGRWLHVLYDFFGGDIPRILLVHKADKISCDTISPGFIDSFVRGFRITDWYYTVGDPTFGDYDSTRGFGYRQRSPIDITITVLKRYFRNIQSQKSIKSDDPPQQPPHLLQATMDAISMYDSIQPPIKINKGDVKPFSIEMNPNNTRAVTYELNYIPNNNNNNSHHDKQTIHNEGSNSDHVLQDESWHYYGGTLSRTEAEDILSERPTGTFLLRRSPDTKQLRIVIKNIDGSMSHIPLKRDATTGMFRVGRTELRGHLYRTLADTLQALALYPSLGVYFYSFMRDGELVYKCN